MMVQTDEPLAPFTYSKIGGRAEKLIIARSHTELVEAVKLGQVLNLKTIVIGSGSNILISDNGLDGLVIINRSSGIKFNSKHPGHLQVESGTLVNQLVNEANRHGFAGFAEFLGLPGTVGGAIYNNSHYFKHLIGDYVTSVTAITKQGSLKKFSLAECGFSYDQSAFQTNGATIISADFLLKPGDPDELSTLAQKALNLRRSSQPLEAKSAGCMFKNPAHFPHSAGYLIDQAGCKKLQVGQAMVSEKHANFIINLGQATAKDYVALSNLVLKRVYQKFKVHLEREIFFLGNHPGLEV